MTGNARSTVTREAVVQRGAGAGDDAVALAELHVLLAQERADGGGARVSTEHAPAVDQRT